MTPQGAQFIRLYQALAFQKPLRDLHQQSPYKREMLLLRERQQILLRSLYDFEQDQMASMEDVAVQWGVTRERIRQLHRKALLPIGRARRNSTHPAASGLRSLWRTEIAVQKGSPPEQVVLFARIHLNSYPLSNAVRLVASIFLDPDTGVVAATKAIGKLAKAERVKGKLMWKAERKVALADLMLGELLDQTFWPHTLQRRPFDGTMRPQRQVGSNEAYRSGVYESTKTGRSVQYESGLELSFIQTLEYSALVAGFVEQPMTIQYSEEHDLAIYTPDFLVTLRNGERLFVEVKDQTAMLDRYVLTKLQALWAYCEKEGIGLLLTDGRHTLVQFARSRRNRPFETCLLNLIGTPSDIVYHAWLKNCFDKADANYSHLYAAVFHHQLSYRKYPLQIRKVKAVAPYWSWITAMLNMSRGGQEAQGKNTEPQDGDPAKI